MDGILIEDLTEQTSLAESDNLIVGGSDANKITVANVISALKDLGLLNELGNKIFYATCSTAAATAAKVVTTTEDGFELTTGVMIAVYFSNGNSASSVTLNVNDTGAKTMYAAYTSTTDGSSKQYRWMTGDVIIFVYNGTGWRTVNKGMATTTYYGLTKLTDSTSSTSTTTAATPNSVKTAYDAAVAAQSAADTAQKTADELSSKTWAFEYVTDGVTVTAAANTRTTGTFTYPDSITSHDFAFPIAINPLNGYVQATITKAGTTSCEYTLHNIQSSSVSCTIYVTFVTIG